jgi:hypothetical protein
MVTATHASLTGSECHEPKGATTASTNHVYHADGLGSGAWYSVMAHGGWRYNDIGTGTTFTTPSSYTLCDVTGAASTLDEFTFNNAGRLTYTGTPNRSIHGVYEFSFKHSTGSSQDVYFAAYLNGSILQNGSYNAEMVVTADSANYMHISAHFHGDISTNDYFEIYLKTASGNVIIHSAHMNIMGMLQ